MRIAITYDNGNVYPHFGKTSKFNIFEINDGKIIKEEILDTNGNGHSALAGFLLSKNIDGVICGNIGAGAKASLEEVNIKYYAGVTGTVKDTITAFLNGKLKYNNLVSCNHHKHDDHEYTCSEHGCNHKHE